MKKLSIRHRDKKKILFFRERNFWVFCLKLYWEMFNSRLAADLFFKNPIRFQSNPILLKFSRFSCNFIQKRDSGTDVFLWILPNFSEHLFTEYLWATASTYLFLERTNFSWLVFMQNKWIRRRKLPIKIES